jgi:hypothetical protein
MCCNPACNRLAHTSSSQRSPLSSSSFPSLYNLLGDKATAPEDRVGCLATAIIRALHNRPESLLSAVLSLVAVQKKGSVIAWLSLERPVVCLLVSSFAQKYFLVVCRLSLFWAYVCSHNHSITGSTSVKLRIRSTPRPSCEHHKESEPSVLGTY